MTIDDLKTSLRCALETGKPGNVVSMRVHLHLPSDSVSVDEGIAAIVSLIETAIVSEPMSVMIRNNGTGRHRSFLFRFKDGQTALFTVTVGLESAPSVHVLVIGNHGIVKLEGSDLSIGSSAIPGQSELSQLIAAAESTD